MALIDNYITDLVNIQRLYQSNWVLPYGSAYAVAFDKFKETLASQEKFDKVKAELAIMALTLGVGGALAGMFGKACMRGMVIDQAVNLVCNRNMTRTFNAMAVLASSPAGTFIAKQSWDNISTLLKNEVKQQVEGLVTRSPLGMNTIQNPQVFQNDLQEYLLRTISAAHSVAVSVRDNFVMTSSAKDEVARNLRAAPLFKGAPRRDVTGKRTDAVKDIELSLYMVLVMGSDYIKETTFYIRGARDGFRTRRVGSISQATTSSDYPTASSTHSHGPGYVNDRIRTVEYDRLGSIVMDRINTLHQERIGSRFQIGSYARDELARAERLTERLQRIYLRMM